MYIGNMARSNFHCLPCVALLPRSRKMNTLACIDNYKTMKYCDVDTCLLGTGFFWLEMNNNTVSKLW